jgi:hypothetical protein
MKTCWWRRQSEPSLSPRGPLLATIWDLAVSRPALLKLHLEIPINKFNSCFLRIKFIAIIPDTFLFIYANHPLDIFIAQIKMFSKNFLVLHGGWLLPSMKPVPLHPSPLPNSNQSKQSIFRKIKINLTTDISFNEKRFAKIKLQTILHAHPCYLSLYTLRSTVPRLFLSQLLLYLSRISYIFPLLPNSTPPPAYP